MNFTGWVPIRRSILEHTMTGALSGNEFMVLTTLILLADKSTGRGTINAPSIHTYLPGLKYDSAKRTLQSLEEQGYIWRQITPMSKLVYPYWVNRYEITDGPHSTLQTDLSQVFESRDIKDIRYVKAGPHTPLHTAARAPLQKPLHTPLQKPLNNNKDTDKDFDNKKDNTTTDIGNASDASPPVVTADSGSKAESSGADSSAISPPRLADSSATVRVMVAATPLPPRSHFRSAIRSELRMQWEGDRTSGRWVDPITKEPLPHPEVAAQLALVDLEKFGQEYYAKGTADTVGWDIVQQRVEARRRLKVMERA
jgi:hypothetical protein